MIAGDPESVISILKLRRDTGATRTPRHLDVVTPGTSAGGAPRAAFGAARIALGRDRIVPGIEPVIAPLVDVVAHIEESETVGVAATDRLGTCLPEVAVTGERLGRRVAPRKQRALAASPSGTFPFGFGWKTEKAAGLLAEPITVADYFEP